MGLTTGRTFSMRSKEEAHDYRYFPEPDLPPVVVNETRIAAVRATMTELPEARRRRFVDEYGLPQYDAGVLTQSAALANYFEQVRPRPAIRKRPATGSWARCFAP